LSLFWILIIGGIILSIAAFVSFRRVSWTDTGLYHFQAIRWLSQFGVVPGLALLHHRFGFTSSWFALAAPFNFDIFESRLTTLTGGYILLIATLHFLISAKRLWNNQAYLEDWFITIALFWAIGFTSCMGMPISPSPDLPIIFLTLTIAWLFIKIGNFPATFFILDARLIPLILSAGAFTIKISSLLLLFVSLIFYVLNKTQKIKYLVIGSLFVCIIVLPSLVFSIVTSGCPLYPSSFACLDLPWSFEHEQLKYVSNIVISWARWSGPAPENANSWNWIWPWLTSDNFNLNRQMILLITLSPILSLVYQFVPKRSDSDIVNQNKILILLGVGGTTYLIFTAPTLRFGLGYLLILPSFFLGLICYQFSSKLIAVAPVILGLLLAMGRSTKTIVANDNTSLLKNYAVPTLMLITLLLACILFIFKFFGLDNYLKSSILRYKMLIIRSTVILVPIFILVLINSVSFGFLPPPLISDIPIITRQVNDVTYFTKPEGQLCWAVDLPCTPEQPANIQLRLPKSGFGKGFIH
jgi:hypothetical protein